MKLQDITVSRNYWKLALLKGKWCSILSSLLGRNFLCGKSITLQEEEGCIYNITVACRLNVVFCMRKSTDWLSNFHPDFTFLQRALHGRFWLFRNRIYSQHCSVSVFLLHIHVSCYIQSFFLLLIFVQFFLSPLVFISSVLCCSLCNKSRKDLLTWHLKESSNIPIVLVKICGPHILACH